MAWEVGKLYHPSLSVDVDRFSDAYLKRTYLNGLSFDGETLTVDRLRSLCAEARALGQEALGMCDNVNEKGLCQGHDPEAH